MRLLLPSFLLVTNGRRMAQTKGRKIAAEGVQVSTHIAAFFAADRSLWPADTKIV
jgi:hypothetical protein